MEVNAIRKAHEKVRAALKSDARAARAVWYSTAGSLVWMEVSHGSYLYGVLVAVLSLHYENMPGNGGDH